MLVLCTAHNLPFVCMHFDDFAPLTRVTNVHRTVLVQAYFPQLSLYMACFLLFLLLHTVPPA